LYLLDQQKRFYFLEKLHGNLPTGHKKGGQSAPRFQRMYLSALDAYNKKIVSAGLKHFRTSGASFIKKLIITGNGIRKKHLTDEFEQVFPNIRVFSHSSIQELTENLRDCEMLFGEENKMYLHILELLETSSELLLFGNEVLQNHHELKTIISTKELEGIPKAIIFNESTPEYKWLQSFGGIIGVKYF